MSDRERNADPTSIVSYWRSIALPVVIVLVAVEVQRNWGSGSGWIYLFAELLLGVVWIGSLLGHVRSKRMSGAVIDIALFTLLLCGVFLPSLSGGRVGSEILKTILFWAPAICGWWALSYHDQFRRVLIYTALLYSGLYFLEYPDSERHYYEYALIGVMIIGLGRLIAGGMAIKFKQDFEKLSAQTSDAPLRDPMTGVASKMSFEAELFHISAVANRYRFPFSLAVCSLDGFDHYMDKYGEDAAIDLLKRVSWQIAERIRTPDTICHWDSNEFAILLPGTTEQDAIKVAENIRLSASTIPNAGEGEVTLHVATSEHQFGEDPMATFDTVYRRLELSRQDAREDQTRKAATWR